MRIEKEVQRRRALWTSLKSRFDPPDSVPPTVLNELRIFRGQAGIWVDVIETRDRESTTGITVGLLHKGGRYPDELRSDGLTYHYPVTDRPGTDAMEIAATKTACRLEVPVFVITPGVAARTRNVHFSRVSRWDDERHAFEVEFLRE